MLSLTLVVACASAASAALVGFDDLTLGTSYDPNDTFTSGGVDITVQSLPTSGSVIVQDSASYAPLGSGNVLWVGGGREISFDVPTDTTFTSFELGLFHSGNSITINGSSGTIPFGGGSFQLGGTTVTVTQFGSTPGGPLFDVDIDGALAFFQFSGVESVMDNVEFTSSATAVPEPSSAFLLLCCGAAAWRTRRKRHSN